MVLTPDDKHRMLREVYRHYIDFQDFWQREGLESFEYQGLTFNFMDLKDGIEGLSGRKKEAFYLNVIRDMKQKDVAEIMKITTVSVGQYVDAACRQLADIYWSKEDSNTTK